jgi:2-polyprenyl-6-methoxyphenol hydroxylase-like FAD-dependent oxidoreductase
MTTSSPEILIVGAGPTGLAAAALLSKLGVQTRIIDKNSGRSTQSKALGVQAGTLECVEAALGKEWADRMVQKGRPVLQGWLHLNEKEPLHLNLSTIPSQHNYILILAQSETEKILEDCVNAHGLQVERQTELLETTEDGIHAISKVRLPSGEIETVKSKFVLGADGAHSLVRKTIGTDFAGGEYDGDFILGDVILEWPWPYECIRIFILDKGIIAAFPLPGERHYRLILIPHSKENSAKLNSRDINLEEFKTVVNELSTGKIKVESSTWLTRFSVHHRRVKHFSRGPFFLAGDAAHIHSPAGGQGMNTGIQDAFNLAFKLKKVLVGEAPTSTLSNYEAERAPIAKNVLRGTDIAFNLALSPNASILRNFALPFLVNTPWIQHQVVTALSEVRVARKEIARYPKS